MKRKFVIFAMNPWQDFLTYINDMIHHRHLYSGFWRLSGKVVSLRFVIGGLYLFEVSIEK